MSSDGEGGEWVSMCTRDEWKGLTPIPQDDGPAPVARISYSERFVDVMNYFRAVLASDERSPRALRLTALAIDANAGNYTVWHFRRVILEFLNADLDKELPFLENMAMDNPKNYQIWHHRRWVAEKRGLKGKDDELGFTEKVLREDAKNYHAWSHRQWVLQALGGWETELHFCNKLLQQDIYNNSAWNQRYFVLTRSPLGGSLSTSEVVFCREAISFAPDNESAWRYLAGLFKDKRTLAENADVASVCVQELAKNNCCVHGLSLFLELLCYGFQPTSDDCMLLGLADGTNDQMAAQVCDRLQVADRMRANYWAWRCALLTTPN